MVKPGKGAEGKREEGRKEGREGSVELTLVCVFVDYELDGLESENGTKGVSLADAKVVSACMSN